MLLLTTVSCYNFDLTERVSQSNAYVSQGFIKGTQINRDDEEPNQWVRQLIVSLLLEQMECLSCPDQVRKIPAP